MPVVAEDLNEMTKAQLRAEARMRGLSDRGTKAALLERLRDSSDDDESDDVDAAAEDDDVEDESDDDWSDDDDDDDDVDDVDDVEDGEARAEDDSDEDVDDDEDWRAEDDSDDEDDDSDVEDEDDEDGDVDEEDGDVDEEDGDVDEDWRAEDDSDDEDSDADSDDEADDDTGADDAPSSQERSRDEAGGGRSTGRTLDQLVARARDSITTLTGRTVDAVSGVQRVEDGYCVTLEVLEVGRVPPTTDVLATYEVDLDGDGDVVSFTKTTRYYRNQRLGD